MTVTVEPDTFALVDFSADDIAALVEELASAIGLSGVDVVVRVDETTPLGRTHLVSTDPAVVIEAESGALENPRVLRAFHRDRSAAVLGCELVRACDRRDPAFGAPASDGDLDLRQRAVWETYAAGRLARLGYGGQRQRHLYVFRNRHGFTDVADAAFDRVWSAADLTWAELEALSVAAASANPGRLTA